MTPTGDEPPHEITADDILSGKTLQVCAASMMHKGITRRGRPAAFGTIRVASLCSGSEMVSVVLDAITEECVQQKVPLTFKTVLACELDAKKRLVSRMQVASLTPTYDLVFGT